VDECLSPALVRDAQDAGAEAYHVAHLGRAGLTDREIAAYAIGRDLILVTNNANDFRRIYRIRDLHPGLIVLIPNVARPMQQLLFRAAVARLHPVGEMVNRALEIAIECDSVTFHEYELSRGGR
jgi:predicted nuclease of predicted toxin-antitoxin system